MSRSRDLEQSPGLRARIVQDRERATASSAREVRRSTAEEVFVGIDVSKVHLDVALHDEDEVRRVGNDEEGIAGLVTAFCASRPTLVVLEATGGLEMPLAAALAAAEVPVVIANPRQTRDFARATGQLSKTDAIDARGPALFAARIRPAVRPIPGEAAQALDALVARRRQIIGMRTQEKSRLGFALRPVQKGIKKHIAWLETEGPFGASA